MISMAKRQAAPDLQDANFAAVRAAYVREEIERISFFNSHRPDPVTGWVDVAIPNLTLRTLVAGTGGARHR
jgi:hypothetical protein